MNRVALFPGSFDPFTIGHEEIVRRGLVLFDKIVIAVGINSTKKEFLTIENRLKIIEKTFKDEKGVEVVLYKGLTTDLCSKLGINIIIRGLRTASDFEYERAVGQANKSLNRLIETVFILTSPEHTFVSSTIVRNIYENMGDITKFLSSGITTEIITNLLNGKKIE